MTTTGFNIQNERWWSLTSRLLFFDDNDYTYWKTRMIIYLQSIDYDSWLSIKNEPHMPTKIENV